MIKPVAGGFTVVLVISISQILKLCSAGVVFLLRQDVSVRVICKLVFQHITSSSAGTKCIAGNRKIAERSHQINSVELIITVGSKNAISASARRIGNSCYHTPY